MIHTNNLQNNNLYKPSTINPQAYIRVFITAKDVESDIKGGNSDIKGSVAAPTPQKVGDTIIVATRIASQDNLDALGITNYSIQPLFAFYNN